MAAVEAPDYVEPVLGWRLWHIVEREGRLLLLSPLYRTPWLPRQEVLATCHVRTQRRPLWAPPGRVRHEAPDVACSCGIHGSRTAAKAAPYLTRFFREREDVLHRVIGRVALWGTVVEGRWGWRAAAAYPAQICVPVPQPRWRSLLAGFRAPALPPGDIASGLEDYGVPVELVRAASPRELATFLDAVPLRPAA